MCVQQPLLSVKWRFLWNVSLFLWYVPRGCNDIYRADVGLSTSTGRMLCCQHLQGGCQAVDIYRTDVVLSTYTGRMLCYRHQQDGCCAVYIYRADVVLSTSTGRMLCCRHLLGRCCAVEWLRSSWITDAKNCTRYYNIICTGNNS